MKPIILVEQHDEEGYIKLSRPQLESIIDEAYKHGKADATRPYYAPLPNWYIKPPYEITCGGTGDITPVGSWGGTNSTNNGGNYDTEGRKHD